MSEKITMVSHVDAAHKSGTICIRPYFDPEKENLGLENYGMSLFDGVFQEEQLALIDKNGVRRYITGLDEFAPEVKMIKDEKEKEAKIREIRVIVAQLEKEIASNIIDPKDKDFWNKVVMLKPNNVDFWSQITIRCGNTPVPLDPNKDPFDLIKICAIEAGGFSLVARSYEHARSLPQAPKFYLDKTIDTIAIKTELAKSRNVALAKLQEMFDKNASKLFYVAKVVDINSVQYKKSTPVDIIYDNMDKFITGLGIEKNQRRAAVSFSEAAELDMETLKIKAIIKDATYHKTLVLKTDGHIYHVKSATVLGKTVQDCVEYLKNPLNDEIFQTILTEVEKFWNL